MNPKYDRDEPPKIHPHETTQRMLARAMQEGIRLDPATARILWEDKVMERLDALEAETKALKGSSHDTIQIAAIAQNELKPYKKIREFWEACELWKRRIIKWTAATAVTGMAGWVIKHLLFK